MTTETTIKEKTVTVLSTCKAASAKDIRVVLNSIFVAGGVSVADSAKAKIETFAERWCSNFSMTGQWGFVHLSNGTYFLLPPEKEDGQYDMYYANQAEETVSREAAGVWITYMVVNHILCELVEKDDERLDALGEHLTEVFYKLKDFWVEHVEMPQIWALQD